ncbi:MAG: hypothetical protein KIT48_16590 [Pseudolabrys sp.]|nr:hypothetical protein [Pseudolabrys sp.]
MTERPLRRKTATLLTVPALALLLSACGSSNPQEDKLGTFLVAPGKYFLFDCQQLNTAAANYVNRREVLRQAMADAEKSPGGGVVSLLAYRGEYGQVQGNLAEINREAAGKNCTIKPPAPAAPAAAPPPPPKRRGR